MTLIVPKENLRRGIWPRSFPLWVTAFYMSLFIIRPWEVLFPWLAEIRFHKLYGIFMIVVVMLSNKKQLKINLQALMVIFFIFAIGISAIFARDPSLTWDPLYEYITFAIFFFILIFVVRNPYELLFIVTCYIVIMSVYLAKSQWEFFVHGQHRYDMGVYRLTGIEDTFGGPNSLAMSIVVSLPMLIFLWSIRKEFTNEWPNSWRKWFPYFLIFSGWLSVSSIILTNSRSGMVSFILFVILTTLRGRGIGKKIGYVLVGCLILIMIWAVMPEEKRNRFRTIWDLEAGPKTAQISAQGRIEGYKAGMTMFERFPLTGVGIGNFIEYRVKFVDGVALNAHNLAGQVLGETGIIGGITFILMMITALINCYKIKGLSKRNRSDRTIEILSNFGLACRDSIILLFFEGLFAHNGLRYNWLWLAAFSSLASEFAKKTIKNK